LSVFSTNIFITTTLQETLLLSIATGQTAKVELQQITYLTRQCLTFQLFKFNPST